MREQTVRHRNEAATESLTFSAGMASKPAMRRVDSRTLFDGGQEIRIMHQGQEYRLRMTRNDKLILTK